MAITVSPYLSTPAPLPAAPDAKTAGLTNSAPAPASSNGAPADQVTLSPQAQQSIAADTDKTPLQSTLEMILDGVKNASGPTLRFFRASLAPAPGGKVDESC